MREQGNPLDEARERREGRQWEDSERKLEDTEMTRSEFYMPHDVPGSVPPRDDKDISRDIESSLFYDDRVRSYEVKCDVSSGNVTITGEVEDDSLLRLIEDRVRAVPGVRGITNNLKVKS
jgi:osmotically-inducible protein OsmY